MTAKAALLFDLDGTLVDTDHLHHAAFVEILSERGRDLPLAEYRAEIMGQHNGHILDRYFPGEDPAILDRKEDLFRDALAVSVEPIAGIHALLDWAAEQGIGTAVVTNAPRRNALAMLAAAGLAPRLPTLVIGEECVRPKPDPAPYQAGMAALGATPSRSFAFEDSRSGIRAARSAGAHVFGMTTGLSPAELIQAGAHEAIADFTDPVLWTRLEQLRTRVA